LRAVSEIVLDGMLQPMKDRTDAALALRTRWENLVEGKNSGSRPPTSTPKPAATASPSSQPASVAPPHSRPSTRPPPPPPGFYQEPSTSRPPTIRSIVSAGGITIRDIADHLRRLQRLRLLQPMAKFQANTSFSGLRSALSMARDRNHVGGSLSTR
jgi:hypothetical protein